MTPEQWKRARLVLEGAKRHSAEDRSQYISVACADDPELQREVESLLNLSSTPSPGSRSVVDASGPALTQWEHLTVLAEVGRGAFGRVYRAWDAALQMEVALKLIRVDGREEFADSVFHEARLLVKVRHPNVVTVLGARRVGPDVGIWMEFVHGLTLADVVERDGPMGAVEAGAAGMAICDALAAVHAAGLLHRDIKARNVMRDASGRIVVMDFGAGADRRQLPSGELAGTPLYMAPEVLKGAGATVASDLYSVGVLLFHLVTGDYPVSGSTIYELEAAHERGDRVRIGERRPDLPESFAMAIDRALAADPRQRFRRAVELRSALSDATAQLTAPVVAPSRVMGEDRWPWIIGLAAVALLAGLTAIGFLTTAAFNQFLDRESPFVTESPLEWPIWGIRAVLAPCIYMAVMFVAGVLARWFFVVAAKPLRKRRGGAGGRERHGRLSNPNTILRVVAGIGGVTLIVIVWQFGDLLYAVMSYINVGDPEIFAPLAPGPSLERFVYRRLLELTMVVVGVGLYRAVRLKRVTGVSLDWSATACAVGVLGIAVLMSVIPYRIAWQRNEFPRAQFAGMRCYVLGQDVRSLLLYCPESAAPRNVIRPRNDPRVRLEGFTESLFVPADDAARPSS